MSEEIFDVVNAQDEVVGHRVRHEVHRLGLMHRAVHVLVFNAQGEVFLQKRSLKKDIAAGKWDSSSSGHLDRGEAYDDCAVREVREEIGLQLPQPPARLFKLEACPETGWEFCWIELNRSSFYFRDFSRIKLLEFFLKCFDKPCGHVTYNFDSIIVDSL